MRTSCLRPRADRPWRARSSTSLDEVKATYEEYLWVEGFDRKKAELRAFLEASGVELPAAAR